jgi:nucleoside-diphosphate-sugar epimerase
MTDTALLVVGTGYVGTELARQAREKDWRVAGTTRSEGKVEALTEIGVEAIDWDIQGSSFGQLVDEIDGFDEHSWQIVYSIPTIYREYQHAEDGAPPRHVQPIEGVLEALDGLDNLEQFVYLSSTSVYGNHDGDWVDEEAECRPKSPVGKMRLDIEEAVLSHRPEMNTSVSRLSGIYGPGRTMLSLFESGRYKLVDGGEKPTNRIHVSDIVSGLFRLFSEKPEDEHIFNFSDGNPKTSRELAEFLSEVAGVPMPDEIPMEEYAKERSETSVARWRDTYRISNKRLRESLGLDLEYEDVFEGYKDLLRSSQV